jgi:hypothetical protein
VILAFVVVVGERTACKIVFDEACCGLNGSRKMSPIIIIIIMSKIIPVGMLFTYELIIAGNS